MTSAAAPRRYTYADLIDLPEDQRFEIIDGELFVNPSPVTRHQRIAARLYRALFAGLEEPGRGEVFIPPFDVVLDAKGENVAQPDVLFISTERAASVITEKNARGAPDLVVEVLSPGTRQKDLTKKMAMYARFAVPLYLVIDPDADRAELYRLRGGSYEQPVVVAAPGVLEIPAPAAMTLDVGALLR